MLSEVQYKGPVFRGSWALGNNCKICERCIATKPTNPRPPMTEITPEALEACTLADCPPGLFMFNGMMGFKSEYTTTLENPRRYQCDAYVVESGEYFHGGAKSTQDRAALIVIPLRTGQLILAQPSGDDYAARIQALETSLAEAEGRVIADVVKWLRDENGQCDCFARSEGECACGAWDDYKTKPLLDIATALETGEWRNAQSV